MATETALDNFVRNLLVDPHKGEITTLVVDNAASSLTGAGPPLRYSFLQAGSLPVSSNHSRNRWLSGEGSPQRETMKTIPTTTAESSPTVLTDAPIKNGNLLPAFPVRKLSPQVHHRALTSERRSLPHSVFQLYDERSPRWSSTPAVEKHNQQQEEQSIRPPLSPRKNATGQEQNGGVSINKIAPLQSPLRSPSSSNKSVSLQWSPSLVGHRSINTLIFAAPTVWIGDQEDGDCPLFLDDSSMKDDMPPPASQRPTRGLSATLGTTDLPISPPIPPERQVSAQIYDPLQDEDETLSFYDSFLDEEDDESRLQGIEDE